jgi:hypothetical protein
MGVGVVWQSENPELQFETQNYNFETQNEECEPQNKYFKTLWGGGGVGWLGLKPLGASESLWGEGEGVGDAGQRRSKT